MELSHGRLLTLDKAEKMGVLSAAEGLIRESPDKPWEMIVPADVPTQQEGDGKDSDPEGEPDMDNDDIEAEMTASKPKNVSLHRALHSLNKGGLHRALGVPEGEPIPAEKLTSAKNSDNPHVAHMAHFAETMSHFHHGS